MIRKCFFFALLVAVSLSNQKSLNNIELASKSIKNDFDYLILRQIWPESSCLFPGKNKCVINKQVSTWCVHGLWPTIQGTMGPSFCNKDMPFNFEAIKRLESDLNKFWPNLYENTAYDSFWKHEWEKHGTCSLSLPQIKSEIDYFNVSLQLRNKFDFGRILTASSIVADDKKNYDLSLIKMAIKKAIKVEPLVECYRSGDVQYIAEMQICLSKDFEPIECGSSSNFVKKGDIRDQETQCSDNIPVRYPIISNTLDLNR